MKKWYICTLVIAFTLLGYISKEQSALPNQKIVLQFSNTTIASNEIENTVATVKKQLLDFGVANIQIHEIENGQLQITYHSDADVLSIKKTLSKIALFGIDFASNEKEESTKTPSKKDTANYNLDVFKILDKNDANSGFDGKVALEPKAESDRFFNPTVNFFASLSEEKSININVLVAYKVSTNIAVAINTVSYKIPEVRAGPSTKSTS